MRTMDDVIRDFAGALDRYPEVAERFFELYDYVGTNHMVGVMAAIKALRAQ